jgi:hypothetical protein
MNRKLKMMYVYNGYLSDTVQNKGLLDDFTYYRNNFLGEIQKYGKVFVPSPLNKDQQLREIMGQSIGSSYIYDTLNIKRLSVYLNLFFVKEFPDALNYMDIVFLEYQSDKINNSYTQIQREILNKVNRYNTKLVLIDKDLHYSGRPAVDCVVDFSNKWKNNLNIPSCSMRLPIESFSESFSEYIDSMIVSAIDSIVFNEDQPPKQMSLSYIPMGICRQDILANGLYNKYIVPAQVFIPDTNILSNYDKYPSFENFIKIYEKSYLVPLLDTNIQDGCINYQLPYILMSCTLPLGFIEDVETCKFLPEQLIAKESKDVVKIVEMVKSLSEQDYINLVHDCVDKLYKINLDKCVVENLFDKINIKFV